jgi:hypothetical protein
MLQIDKKNNKLSLATIAIDFKSLDQSGLPKSKFDLARENVDSFLEETIRYTCYCLTTDVANRILKIEFRQQSIKSLFGIDVRCQSVQSVRKELRNLTFLKRKRLVSLVADYASVDCNGDEYIVTTTAKWLYDFVVIKEAYTNNENRKGQQDIGKRMGRTTVERRDGLRNTKRCSTSSSSGDATDSDLDIDKRFNMPARSRKVRRVLYNPHYKKTTESSTHDYNASGESEKSDDSDDDEKFISNLHSTIPTPTKRSSDDSANSFDDLSSFLGGCDQVESSSYDSETSRPKTRGSSGPTLSTYVEGDRIFFSFLQKIERQCTNTKEYFENLFGQGEERLLVTLRNYLDEKKHDRI